MILRPRLETKSSPAERREVKLLSLSDVQIKSIDEEGNFEGYISKYNNVDAYGDMVMPGAYSATLKSGRPISMYFNHQYRQPGAPARIGVWLEFREVEDGVIAKGKLIMGHPFAAGIHASMKAGVLTGLSIGYYVPAGGAKQVRHSDGREIRQLFAIELVEVSIVDDPADPHAQISLDSVKSVESIRDAEQFLRDAGLTASEAKTFIARLKGILRSEQELDPAKKAEQEALEALRNLYSNRNVH